MKHLLLGITMVGATAVLAGCPIYPDSGNYRVCDSSGCFDCPDTRLSGACVPWPCNTSGDCAGGSVCSYGVCGPVSSSPPGPPSNAGASCASTADCSLDAVCGRDGTCHVGDCGGSVGCVDGLVCKVEGGAAVCVNAGGPPDGGSIADAHADSSVGDAGPIAMGDGAARPPIDAAIDGAIADAFVFGVDGAFDASDGSVSDAATPIRTPCNADSQCGDAGASAKCVDGQCLAQSQLCSDATQCVVKGDSCVDGICTPQCSASLPCAAGFGCDFTRHVCSDNPRPCVGNGDCQGGTVCVEGHCAAPCAPADAGPACPAGQVCVNAGCIPDQRATFACFNDGEQGALANRCDPADICLHGDCYVACDITSDAGACGAAMSCKEVTVAKGTFAVCGSATTLGSACDVAAGRSCSSGAACVDGYCL